MNKLHLFAPRWHRFMSYAVRTSPQLPFPDWGRLRNGHLEIDRPSKFDATLARSHSEFGPHILGLTVPQDYGGLRSRFSVPQNMGHGIIYWYKTDDR